VELGDNGNCNDDLTKALEGKECSRFGCFHLQPAPVFNAVLDHSPPFLLHTGYGAAWQHICHNIIEVTHTNVFLFA